jgi:hypothetical protein
MMVSAIVHRYGLHCQSPADLVDHLKDSAHRVQQFGSQGWDNRVLDVLIHEQAVRRPLLIMNKPSHKQG